MKNLRMVCECNWREHQIEFVDIADDDDPLERRYIAIAPHLSQLPLCQRVRYAIKYILGYQSKFGAFGEILINIEQAIDLRDWIDRWLVSGSCPDELDCSPWANSTDWQAPKGEE